jgi:cystathionine beta-lyase/cystathionine gamma-synthase
MASVQSNTRMIVIESPTNPLLAVLDNKQIAQFAKQKNIITIIDNTFVTLVTRHLWILVSISRSMAAPNILVGILPFSVAWWRIPKIK